MKNIPRPVRIFRARLDDQGEPGTTPHGVPRSAPRVWRRPILLGGLAVALAGVLGLGVRLARDRGQPLEEFFLVQAAFVLILAQLMRRSTAPSGTTLGGTPDGFGRADHAAEQALERLTTTVAG